VSLTTMMFPVFAIACGEARLGKTPEAVNSANPLLIIGGRTLRYLRCCQPSA
jgi:hypothetical protein